MPKGVYVRTEEHRRRIGEASKGRIAWNKGKKMPPRPAEHRRNHANAMRGRFTGSDSPHWKGGIPKSRRRDLRLIEIFRMRPTGLRCFFCSELITRLEGKGSDSINIHSLDGDHENWEPENKVPTHQGCHTSHHNTGERHPQWQGDAASVEAKRLRAWRRHYELERNL